MKKLILLALPLMMVGCHYSQKDNEEFYNNRYITIVVDSCEYLVYDGNDIDMTHKGNCRFCAERRKQEIKELIEEIRK